MAGPAAGIIDLYSRRAQDWDEDRGRSLIERPWLDAFLAGVPPGGSVLDLGCGSGEPVAGHLIANGRRLTGVDAAPGLIDLCRSRFPDHVWKAHDFRTLALGRTFDGLIAWNSVFHLTPADQRRMFAVYARHAAPGAMLMFTSGSEAGETVGEWRGEPLYHASLSRDDYARLLAGAGFKVLVAGVCDPARGDATVWLARARRDA